MSDRTKSLANTLIASLQQDLQTGLVADAESAQLAIDCLKASLALSEDVATTKEPSQEDIERAEQFKTDGNAALSADNSEEAIKFYQEAIKLMPKNAIYHSNLSAALLHAGRKEDAKESAQASTKLDPSYAKGYIRVANAESALGNKEDAVKAVEQGLLVNPNNAALETHLKTLKSASPVSSSAAGGSRASPLAGLMNNPEIMRMAQQMMGNGGMEGLMNNPQVAEMLKNPQLMEMMKQFMPSSPPPPPNN